MQPQCSCRRLLHAAGGKVVEIAGAISMHVDDRSGCVRARIRSGLNSIHPQSSMPSYRFSRVNTQLVVGIGKPAL